MLPEGDKLLASFSNSALVITVLQSAADTLDCGVLAPVAGLAAVAWEAGLGCGEHTPFTVMTAAVSGTDSDVSAAPGACGLI
jgi:hypothetical protein